MEEDVLKRIGLSDMNGLKYMLYGSSFILAVDSSLFPLDTIKTMQMGERGASHPNSSTFKRILGIAKSEGLLRFWRGIGPSVLGSFPGQALYYVTYETAQEIAGMAIGKGSSKSITFASGFFAGACAEIVAGLLYVPADVVSQRLQVQSLTSFFHNSRLYHGPKDVVQKVLKNEGYRGFFRGYTAYIIAYAPGSAVTWGSYELFKRLFRSGWTRMEKLRGQETELKFKDQLINGFAGGLASFCAITANNPLEVIRVRTQLLDTRNKKEMAYLKDGYIKFGIRIFQEEGWTAFYRGLRLRMLIAIPSAIIAMTGYETIKEWSVE